jgi:hypothetical protein
MPVAQLVALRNLKNGVTVLTPDRNDPGNYLEFQAAGDPSGGDIQYVSEEMAATPACVKAIMHGILELERDMMSPDVAMAFQRQMDVAKLQRERAEAGITQTIDRPENRDIIGETCVGPGERAGAACGAAVAMRDKSNVDTAPLCSRHNDLAAHYIRVEDNSYNPDGTSQKGYRWLRTHIERREREQG